MPQRMKPKTAWKRGIDERDPEYLLWALIEQARHDYFPEDWAKQTDEDGNPVVTVPMMSMSDLLKCIDSIGKHQERKRKAGVEDKPDSKSADKALDAWRQAAAKKKTL